MNFKQLALCAGLIASSNFAFAELEELDDQSLDDQKGQAGITIDLEFEVSIGEVAWHFNDGKGVKRTNEQTFRPEPPPPIQYVRPGDN